MEDKYLKCQKCNRKLKTELAQKRGFGEYCWKLHQAELAKSRKTLFDLIDTDNK